jgi:hypothetical protein
MKKKTLEIKIIKKCSMYNEKKKDWTFVSVSSSDLKILIVLNQ